MLFQSILPVEGRVDSKLSNRDRNGMNMLKYFPVSFFTLSFSKLLGIGTSLFYKLVLYNFLSKASTNLRLFPLRSSFTLSIPLHLNLILSSFKLPPSLNHYILGSIILIPFFLILPNYLSPLSWVFLSNGPTFTFPLFPRYLSWSIHSPHIHRNIFIANKFLHPPSTLVLLNHDDRFQFLVNIHNQFQIKWICNIKLHLDNVENTITFDSSDKQLLRRRSGTSPGCQEHCLPRIYRVSGWQWWREASGSRPAEAQDFLSRYRQHFAITFLYL